MSNKTFVFVVLVFTFVETSTIPSSPKGCGRETSDRIFTLCDQCTHSIPENCGKKLTDEMFKALCCPEIVFSTTKIIEVVPLPLVA